MLRISSAYSESWVGWVMLVLLILFVVAISLSPDVIYNSFTTLFSRKERESMFDESVSANFASKVILLIFKVLLASLALQFVVIIDTDSPFSVLHFAIITGIISGFRFLRWLINRLLNYVFSLDVGSKQSEVGYGKLTNCAAVFLYPLLLVLMFWKGVTPLAIYWSMGIWLLVVVLIYLVKAYSIWRRSISGFLYFTLYAVTVESLPRLAIVYSAYLIIIK